MSLLASSKQAIDGTGAVWVVMSAGKIIAVCAQWKFASSAAYQWEEEGGEGCAIFREKLFG